MQRAALNLSIMNELRTVVKRAIFIEMEISNLLEKFRNLGYPHFCVNFSSVLFDNYDPKHQYCFPANVF